MHTKFILLIDFTWSTFINTVDIKMTDYQQWMSFQKQWKEEIHEQLQKIKSEGSNMPQLEEELIKRRREELRYALQT